MKHEMEEFLANKMNEFKDLVAYWYHLAWQAKMNSATADELNEISQNVVKAKAIIALENCFN